MPKGVRREGFVNWRVSAAREILMEDLERGGWLFDDHPPAEIVLAIYKHNNPLEFKDVQYEQFCARYKYACKNANKKRTKSMEEQEWYHRDRKIHPRQLHNHRGEAVFDMHVAKKMLQQDIKKGKHKIMSPSELWESRNEYMQFTLNKFRQRIYQEIRLQKYINYREWKQTQKRQGERKEEPTK